MIFNTSQRTVKLTPAQDVLKIRWKNWKIIVMQMQYLTAVIKQAMENVVVIINLLGNPAVLYS